MKLLTNIAPVTIALAVLSVVMLNLPNEAVAQVLVPSISFCNALRASRSK